MSDAIMRFSGKYRYLSNFWRAEVTLDGVTYPTVEHAYQAAKTLSPDERDNIGQQSTPGDAKRAGRSVVLRPGWDSMRVSVMYKLLKQKFARGTELARRLTETHDAELVEGNHWHDNFWGVCQCPQCRRLYRGKGNQLGRLLMQVRSELQEVTE